MARIRAEWKETHTLDVFVKVTDVCDEKCSDSNERTHKDDLFIFSFGFAVHYSPLSPPCSCLFMVWRVCESWIGSFKELSKCSEGNPPKPRIERRGRKFPPSVGQAALVKHAGSFGPSLSDKYPLYRTAPRGCNPFSICSLHTPGETSPTIL